MSAVRIALALWGGLFLVVGPLSQPAHGDLYWQRWLGDVLLQTHRLPATLGTETFTATGAPWVPQEWFFSLLVALAAQRGLFWLLAIAVSALPLAILWSVYLRSERQANPVAIGVSLLLCGLALAESFGVRAQVLGWAFCAGFLFLIERRDRWYWATIPLTILWANVHASVAIAPAIVAARLVATISGGGLRALRGSLDLVLLPALLLATICTPLGLRLPLYAISLAHSPIRHFIQEWQPAGFGDPAFVFGALPMAFAILIGGKTTLWERRLQSFPAALLFAATVFASRNLPLFAIAAAPLCAVALSMRFPGLVRSAIRVRELERAALASIAVVLALTGAARTLTQRQGPQLLPLTAIATLAADGEDHRVLCEDFTWCSVALTYPRLHVFIDGRCDPYPIEVWQQYIAAVSRKGPSLRPLRDYHVDAVVASSSGALAVRLEEASGWRVAFADRAYVVFRRE